MLNNPKKEIEITARTIIISQGKILLCRHRGRDYYFFPGGHIEFKESAKEALNREIKEELGISIKDYSFIGAVENMYIEDSQEHHEIILAFETREDNLKIQSRENHLEFFLISEDELAKEKVLPIALTKAVLKWLRDKKLFWTSQI